MATREWYKTSLLVYIDNQHCGTSLEIIEGYLKMTQGEIPGQEELGRRIVVNDMLKELVEEKRILKIIVSRLNAVDFVYYFSIHSEITLKSGDFSAKLLIC